MAKNKRIRAGRQAIFFAVLAALLLLFIFSNSAVPRELSAERSSRIMALLRPIFDPQHRVADDVFHHYIRKAAHFSEFAALGFSLLGLADSFFWQRKSSRWLLPQLVSALAAAADETIQIFSVERGPAVKDVCLDIIGAAFGIVCMLFLLASMRGSKKL